MAAPHVAGVAALLQSNNPGLTPSQILSTLQSTARAFPASCSGCGAGIVNAYAAVTAPPPLSPPEVSINIPDSCDGHNYVYYTAVTGATSYELLQSPTPSFTSPLVVYSGPYDSPHDVLHFGFYTEYVKARACNASTCSALSSSTASVIYQSPCP